MPHRRYVLHSEDEESYFVSMTDVVIGLLFIFIIMLMFFAMRFQEATQKQNTLIEDLTDSETARESILQDIGSFLQNRGISVLIVKDEGILRLPEEILFTKGSAELNTKGIYAVTVLGDALNEILPCYTKGPRSREENCPSTKAKIEALFVEGHADSDIFHEKLVDTQKQNSGFFGSFLNPFLREKPKGPPMANDQRRPSLTKDNLDLSASRATSTFRQLLKAKQELGDYWNPDGKPILSVSGYGALRPLPVQTGETLEQWKQRNRRIDLRILMATPRSEEARHLQEDLQRLELR